MSATRRDRRLGPYWAVLCIAGLGLVAGCADSPQDAGTGSAPPAAEIFTGHLARAQEGGASEQQLAVLERAVATGELPFADVNSLVYDTFECLTASGIAFVEDEPREIVPGGPKVPTYSFSAEADGLSPDQVLQLADACIEKHSGYAEQALQDTELYQELRDRRMTQELPMVLECLKENGVTIDANAPLDEVRIAVLTLLNETTDATSGRGSVLCYDDPWTATPIPD